MGRVAEQKPICLWRSLSTLSHFQMLLIEKHLVKCLGNFKCSFNDFFFFLFFFLCSESGGAFDFSHYGRC